MSIVIHILGVIAIALVFIGFVFWAVLGEFYPLPDLIRHNKRMRQIKFLLSHDWKLRLYDGFAGETIQAQASDEGKWRTLAGACERQTILNKIRRLNWIVEKINRL